MKDMALFGMVLLLAATGHFEGMCIVNAAGTKYNLCN